MTYRFGGSTITNQTIIETLNTLLMTANDGKRGYREAADNVNNSDLAQSFRELSQQREQFAAEIMTRIDAIGGTPDDDTSLLADAHRGWMNLKAAIATNTNEAVIEECLRGEDVAISRYEEALELALPTKLRTMLQNQFDHIQASHNKLSSLAPIA